MYIYIFKLITRVILKNNLLNYVAIKMDICKKGNDLNLEKKM